MNEVSQLEALSAGFVTDVGAQWTRLVYLALSIPPKQLDRKAEQLARAAKTNKATLKRKLEAVQWAFSKCNDPEAVIRAGQHETLSRYIKSKKAERVEGLEVMKWSIAPDLKKLVQTEMWRIAKVLKITTSDQLWEFLLSVLIDMDEGTVNHYAGNGNVEKQS